LRIGGSTVEARPLAALLAALLVTVVLLISFRRRRGQVERGRLDALEGSRSAPSAQIARGAQP
jgi:hypothetical protein